MVYSFLYKGIVDLSRTLKEKIKIGFIVNLVRLFFHTQKHLVRIKNNNYPKGQFILSMWHCDQCMVYAVEDKTKFYALISASNDGEIIAKSAECLNIKAVRGSTKRRGVAASFELIEKLKDGNSVGIMVDGPRGPKGKVKDGIINISKLSGVPIVPAVWYSKDKTLLEFNTWDKFRIPLGFCKLAALYGEPIYVPENISKEEIQDYRQKLEDAMNALNDELVNNFEKYV